MYEGTPPQYRLDSLRPTHPQVLHVVRTGDRYRLQLHVSDALCYLEGHFPHMPIVAGVCQLKWVIDYIEAYSGQPLRIRAMEGIKFQRPLLPPQTFTIEFAYEAQEAAWQYRLFTEEQQFAAGRLLVQR